MFRKKQSVAAAAAQLRGGMQSPFGAGLPAVPPGEAQLYRAMRQSLPVLDAAIGKLVRLSGGFTVRSAQQQAALNAFLRTVPCGRGQTGIHSFLSAYLDSLLTYGRAVGEMLVAQGDLRAVCWGDVNALELREGKSPLEVVLCGCESSKVKISGRFVGTEARKVYLEEASPLRQTIVDSTQLADDGSYRFQLNGVSATPALYNVVFNNERIPLLLAGGDRVTLSSAGNVVRNYTVEGSEESALLRQFYQGFVSGAQRLDEIARRVAAMSDKTAERDSLVRAYTDEYYRIRREQLRFIIENKASLAAVYALYQRLPGDTYLFNGDSDVVYYRTVAEAIADRYPTSPYVQSLQAEVERMDARIDLMSRVTERGYPDLELTDMYGKQVRLSSLAGKVVLLDFWSAEAGTGNALNADLKEIYAKYADRGFEVYQVAVDTSKPLWITAVQEQQLPWISVSDLRGSASAALRLYNVQRLPANFLIDRDGNIVAKDLYGNSLVEKLDELTR